MLALCFGQICLNRQKRHLLLVDHHLSSLMKLGFELFASLLIQARAYWLWVVDRQDFSKLLGRLARVVPPDIFLLFIRNSCFKLFHPVDDFSDSGALLTGFNLRWVISQPFLAKFRVDPLFLISCAILPTCLVWIFGGHLYIDDPPMLVSTFITRLLTRGSFCLVARSAIFVFLEDAGAYVRPSNVFVKVLVKIFYTLARRGE